MDLQSELDNIWRGWTIKETLGEGAFGRVYAIERIEFGNVYRSALKVLEVPKSQDEVKSIRAEGMDEDSVTSYFYSMVEDIVAEFYTDVPAAGQQPYRQLPGPCCHRKAGGVWLADLYPDGAFDQPDGYPADRSALGQGFP